MDYDPYETLITDANGQDISSQYYQATLSKVHHPKVGDVVYDWDIWGDRFICKVLGSNEDGSITIDEVNSTQDTLNDFGIQKIRKLYAWYTKSGESKIAKNFVK